MLDFGFREIRYAFDGRQITRNPKSYPIGPKAKPFEPDCVYLYVELWPFPRPLW